MLSRFVLLPLAAAALLAATAVAQTSPAAPAAPAAPAPTPDQLADLQAIADLPPARATALHVFREGRLAPVVGARGTQAVVEEAGRWTEVPADAAVALLPGNVFAPGFVEIMDESLSDAGALRFYHVRLRSLTALPDAYFLLLIVDMKSLVEPRADPLYVARIHGHGALPAGEVVNVQIPLPAGLPADRTTTTLLQVFDRGLEVRTTQAVAFGARFYDKLDRLSHGREVAEWMRRGGNREAAIYRRIPLDLPPAHQHAFAGARFTAIITVDPAGVPVRVEFAGNAPPDLGDHVRATLAAWLFLPRLQGGRAVESRVELPLSFSP